MSRRSRSLRSQLEESLRELIRSGGVVAESAMPSTRTLAADLGVSRRLVLETYEQLVAEGYLISEPRRRTRVARIEPAKPAAAPALLTRPRFELRPRTSDLARFPRREWGQTIGRVLREAPDAALDYPDPQGARTLRIALASYLRRARGVAADPERIVVCGGFTQALSLSTRVLSRGGDGTRVAVEEPGQIGQDRIIAAAGGDCRPVAVDDEGLRVAELENSGASAVVCTAAHQFPTGVLLSSARRSHLLRWAARGGIVIEDDYDAEFRYDRAGIGAVQGLAPEQVIYVGSASKTLAPALRLGWIVAPAVLIDGLAEAKRLEDYGAPTLDQLVLAGLIESGAYDRHLRLMRRLLKRRRDLVLKELNAAMPDLSVNGAAAGLHILLDVPPTVSMEQLQTNADDLGLGLASISRYCLRRPSDPYKLVIGYGALPDASVPEAVRLVTRAIAEA